MGSNDLVTTFDPGFTSRSYEPMDYATYNVRYQEDFNISKTRLKHGGKDLKQSMLAYTNYVVERQNRNGHPGNWARRHTIEIDGDIHSHHVSNSSKFPGINLPFSKIPVLSKPKAGGPPKVSVSYNRFKGEEGILRGNTFPPLNGKQKSRPGKPSVTISVATVSDLYDVTNKTRCEAKVSEVINHDKLHAWLSTDQTAAQPDLSNILTTSKPRIRKNQSVVSKSADASLVSETYENHKQFSDVDYHDDDNPDSPEFARKKHSEDLLKSAIKTLKLMEKELEELPNKDTVPKENLERPKKKKSSKKSKRLKLPEQTLDIIPELECESTNTFSPDGGYASTEVSPACVHYSKRSKMSHSNRYHEDTDDDYDDGIDHDIDETPDDATVGNGPDGSGSRYAEDNLDLQSLHSFKGLTGRGIGSDNVAVLPPISRNQRGASSRLADVLNIGGVSKLNKVKSEIRNKIKRKHKQSY